MSGPHARPPSTDAPGSHHDQFPLSPSRQSLLETYLRAIDGRGSPGHPARDRATLETAFWAEYGRLRSTPEDPGEVAAFYEALLTL